MCRQVQDNTNILKAGGETVRGILLILLTEPSKYQLISGTIGIMVLILAIQYMSQRMVRHSGDKFHIMIITIRLSGRVS